MPDLIIRKAVPQDAPAIYEIMTSAVRNLQKRDWFLDDDLDFIQRHINSSEGYTLVCTADGKTAGFLIIRRPGLEKFNLGYHLGLSDEELLNTAHMESSAVLPTYRGLGIMKKLLSEAVELEKKNGTRYLMVTVHPDNLYSVNNLKAVGFKLHSTQKKYGDWVRSIMYQEI